MNIHRAVQFFALAAFNGFFLYRAIVNETVLSLILVLISIPSIALIILEMHDEKRICREYGHFFINGSCQFCGQTRYDWCDAAIDWRIKE